MIHVYFDRGKTSWHLPFPTTIQASQLLLCTLFAFLKILCNCKWIRMHWLWNVVHNQEIKNVCSMLEWRGRAGWLFLIEQLWILNESAGTHTPLHLVQLQLRSDILVDVAMAVGKKGFSKEDELLLQDFSKNVSTKVFDAKLPSCYTLKSLGVSSIFQCKICL